MSREDNLQDILQEALKTISIMEAAARYKPPMPVSDLQLIEIELEVMGALRSYVKDFERGPDVARISAETAHAIKKIMESPVDTL